MRFTCQWLLSSLISQCDTSSQLRKCPPTHRPTWASSRVIWLPSKLFCSGFTGHLLCDCLLGRHAVSLSVLPTPCALQHLLNHLHLGQNGMQLSCGSGTGSAWDLRQGLMTPHTHTPPSTQAGSCSRLPAGNNSCSYSNGDSGLPCLEDWLAQQFSRKRPSPYPER